MWSMMSRNKHNKPCSLVLVSSDARRIRTNNIRHNISKKANYEETDKKESKQPVALTENKNGQVDMYSAYTHASAHTHLYNTSAIQI